MVSRSDSHASPSSSTRSSVDTSYDQNPVELYEGELDEATSLTESQREILEMLDGTPVRERERAAAQAHRGFGIDVAFASLGAASILGGIVLLFFFAAFGSILLVLGSILCAVAFEHVALSDMSADELDFDTVKAAPVVVSGTINPA